MAEANYALLKYSRSYSSNDPARFSHQSTSSDHEWQHFSNPKLRLSLENATPSDSLRSARVKIVWIAGGGGLQSAEQESNTATILVRDICLHCITCLTYSYRKILI
jgi:hypothetical protein